MKNLVFLEIDNSALLELIARKHDFAGKQGKERMNILVHQLDLNNNYKDNVELLSDDINIIEGEVDLIVCNFAFHYFIANKKQLINIIKFVNYYLKPGGRFVFTAFDGNEIIKLLNENEGEWTSVKGNDIRYSIKKQYSLNVLEPIGQKIQVLLPFSNNNYYEEYLVNISYIESEFSNYNIILENNQSFRDYLDEYRKVNKPGYISMDSDDKKYVGLYHYYCFYKQKNQEKKTGSSIKRSTVKKSK